MSSARQFSTGFGMFSFKIEVPPRVFAEFAGIRKFCRQQKTRFSSGFAAHEGELCLFGLPLGSPVMCPVWSLTAKQE